MWKPRSISDFSRVSELVAVPLLQVGADAKSIGFADVMLLDEGRQCYSERWLPERFVTMCTLLLYCWISFKVGGCPRPGWWTPRSSKPTKR